MGIMKRSIRLLERLLSGDALHHFSNPNGRVADIFEEVVFVAHHLLVGHDLAATVSTSDNSCKHSSRSSPHQKIKPLDFRTYRLRNSVNGQHPTHRNDLSTDHTGLKYVIYKLCYLQTAALPYLQTQ